MKVSLIIPTRNESENLRVLLPQVMSNGYEVVVVDDSDDATAEIAESMGAMVIKGQGKGLGQAIIDGIRASSGDIVVVMDADLSHQPKYIPSLVNPLLDGCDMAIGSRYISHGGTEGWGLKRRIISRFACLLAYPLTRLLNNTSGFFAFRKSLLDGANLKADSWKIMLEVLIKARVKEVKEVPIMFPDRQLGESKFNRKQAIAYLKHLFSLYLYRFRILNFMFVGGIGFVVNMALYYPLTLVFKSEVTFLGQHFYLPPFVFSSFVAIVCNYHLNKIWTFGDRKPKSMGFLRYLGMASTTLLLDMLFLFLLVDYGGLTPVLAAALAIAMVFIIRFVLADKFIWAKGRL